MGRSGDVWGFWIGQEMLCAGGCIERFFIYLFFWGGGGGWQIGRCLGLMVWVKRCFGLLEDINN